MSYGIEWFAWLMWFSGVTDFCPRVPVHAGTLEEFSISTDKLIAVAKSDTKCVVHCQCTTKDESS